MKLITAFVISSLSLAFGSSAFADVSNPAKSRSQVNAELVQAEASGMVPASKVHYPNDAQTQQRNRALYRVSHASRSQK